MIIHFCRRFYQCLYIFGKTGTAIPDAGKQEPLADAFIAADAEANHIHIGAQHLTQSCHLVHERNFCGQKRIGGIFSQLG